METALMSACQDHCHVITQLGTVLSVVGVTIVSVIFGLMNNVNF
jgi:hypothetical protein